MESSQTQQVARHDGAFRLPLLDYVLNAAIVLITLSGLVLIADRVAFGGYRLNPPTVFGFGNPLTTLLVLALVIWGAALLAGALGRGAAPARRLFWVAAAMAAWLLPRGTMDTWLIHMNPAVGPPVGNAYAALLPDYFAIAAIWLAAALLAGALRGLPQQKPWRSPEQWVALAALCAIAAALMIFMAGPAASMTYRGQVYFAAGGGFYVATWLVRKLVHPQPSMLCLAAPLVVGLAGLAWAMARPAPVAPYSHINIMPAFALVRPLPIEMLTLGLAGVCWGLAPARPGQGA